MQYVGQFPSQKSQSVRRHGLVHGLATFEKDTVMCTCSWDTSVLMQVWPVSCLIMESIFLLEVLDSYETLCHNNTVYFHFAWMGGVFQLTAEGRRIFWRCVISERDASSESLCARFAVVCERGNGLPWGVEKTAACWGICALYTVALQDRPIV